jgi:hypothetical protein
MDNQMPVASGRGKTIKSLYFYLVSFVALMMVVWSVADMVNIALKTWIFTKADNYMYGRVPCAVTPFYDDKGMAVTDTAVKAQKLADCEKQDELNQKNEELNRVSQRQMNIVRDISMLVVGIPLFFIHWRIVRRKDENL